MAIKQRVNRKPELQGKGAPAVKQTAAKCSQTVGFVISTEPGSEVYIAGTFNNWDPTLHRLQDAPDSGVFKIELPLPPGRHEYKFIVNGEWRLDPACPAWLPNDMGTLNSVVEV